jgi:hypothetical protein
VAKVALGLVINETNKYLTTLNKGKAYGSGDDTLKILELLTNSELGEVWRGTYQERNVSINKLDEATNQEQKDVLEKMMQEKTRHLEDMRHERIVLFIGFRMEPLSMVTEYLPLGTLHSMIKTITTQLG